MKKVLILLFLSEIAFAGLKEWGAEKAIDLATRLDEALIDLSQSSSDLSCLPKNKRFKINLNLLPFILPPIFPNASLKLKVLGEKKRLPQIALEADYGEVIGLRFAEEMEDIEKARCYTYAASLILKKSLRDNVSIFGGIRNIRGKCEIFLSEKGTSSDWIKREDLPTNVKLDEIAIFSGLYILRGKNGFWSVASGYILKRKKLFSKIELGFGKHWAFSLGIYPEGVFTFHPMLNLRF
ncbi:MAG: hypothetical protein AB1397_06570 [bacterium]